MKAFRAGKTYTDLHAPLAMGKPGEESRKRGGKQDGGKAAAKKAKYVQHSGSSASIPSGTPGVLVTCDTYFEFKAVKEALTLIEEHFDKLDTAGAAASSDASASGKKDISALLAEEVAGLKDKTKQRFKKHDTGVNGCFFVIFPEGPGPSPLDVVLSILKEAKETRKLRARNCNRLLPITHACHCSMDEIKEMALKVVDGHFPSGEGAQCIPFAAEFEHRSSDKLDRLEVINAFVEDIKCPPHKVNLQEPVKTVLIQIVRNVCASAVVTEYRELARYNIKSLTGFEDKGNQVPKKERAGQGSAGGKEEKAAEEEKAVEEEMAVEEEKAAEEEKAEEKVAEEKEKVAEEKVEEKAI